MTAIVGNDGQEGDEDRSDLGGQTRHGRRWAEGCQRRDPGEGETLVMAGSSTGCGKPDGGCRARSAVKGKPRGNQRNQRKKRRKKETGIHPGKREFLGNPKRILFQHNQYIASIPTQVFINRKSKEKKEGKKSKKGKK